MADDPNEITAEQFMQGEEVAAPEPQKKSRSVLFSPVQQRQYELLVRNPKTTTEQFSKWFVDNGFGSPENAGEVLKFFKKNPKAPIANYFNQNELSPTENIPTNDKSQPQPGTPTDWLPDALQGSIERLGLSLGIIDPKTYYGVGNYGKNAVKPANPDVLTNPAIPSWGQRFVRSIGETFDETGSGVNAWILRGAKDVADDQAIRSYAADHNWTPQQLDAALKQAQEERANIAKETRQQIETRNEDEARREGGGVLGSIKRGSADLLGSLIGDANATYAIGGPAESVLGRMFTQGTVNAGTDVITQADEISRGMKDQYDPAETALQFALGAGFQGGVEVLRKAPKAVGEWLKAKLNSPTALDELTANGIDPAELPAGVSPKEAVKVVNDLKAIKQESEQFQRTPEPKPTDVFPTEESRAADAEAWAQEKLGVTPKKEIAPVQEEPIVQDTITKKEADNLFKEAQKPEPQNAKEWEKSLTKSIEDFAKSKDKELAQVSSQATANDTSLSTSTDVPEAPVISPAEETVTKLVDAINSAASIEAKVQRKLYHQARRERLAKSKAVREEIGGEAGLRASLAVLKGELPKADFEAVRPQFSEEEIGGLFDHIGNHSNLRGFETLNAQIGLRKLLDGQLPTASEIKLLDKVFPPDFTKAALKHRTILSKMFEGGANALNLPRSLMSTFDLSAPFTQGFFMVGRKEFWKSFGSMFKSFGSEEAFNGVMKNITDHPNYPWMEEGKLAISDIHGALADKEEQFMSNWAEKIPLVGRGVKASERAYTAFLNKLRADTFNTIFENAKTAGLKPEDDPKFVTDLGKFINNATGRGDLGRFNAAAPVLSGVLFSPRLMAARVNMLRPDTYITLHPEVRKEALKALFSSAAIATTVLGLAKTAGADVETDPRSSDFGKVIVGNTRYNVTGGFNTYITLGARLATNERKSLSGSVKEMGTEKSRFDGSGTRLTTLGDFARSKASPIASFVGDYLAGSNMIGEPFETKKAIADRMIPMFMQDYYDLTKDQGFVKGSEMAVPGLFGVNASTYEPRVNKTDFMQGELIDEGAPEISAEDFMKGDPVDQ